MATSTTQQGRRRQLRRKSGRFGCAGSRLSSLHALFVFYICSFIGSSDVGCTLGNTKQKSQQQQQHYKATVEILPILPFATPVCAVKVRSSSSPKHHEISDEIDNQNSTSRRQAKVATATANAATKQLSLNQILIRAGKRGLGGGLPGAVAGVVQVLALMWLRTLTNYQSRYGTTFRQALRTLLQEGGIRRLYRGLSFALIQAPLTRFVSTAANDGVEAFLGSFTWTKDWGPGRTTIFASIIVGCARVALVPIDTMKTVLQVDSAEGFRNLWRRVRAGKLVVLYQGSMATAVSAIAGHYPWFFTYNFLSAKEWVARLIPSKLLRNAAIGFVASIISDTTTNSLKVIKTTKQALGSKHNSSYMDVVRMIVAADGWKGLFGRGLVTRIVTNALQSILFTVIWRGLSERMQERSSVKKSQDETS